MMPSHEQLPTSQGPKKKKSSADRSEVSGELDVTEGAGQEVFNIGADRIGLNPEEVKDTAEREATLKTIAEKESQRDSLIKAYSQAFKEYVAKREEREATMAMLESQRLSGASKVTDAQMEAFRANDEKMNAEDKYHAEGYKRDAVDLDKEIDALKEGLERGQN